MKKNLLIYMSAGMMALGATSCADYLEKEVDLTLSQDQIFSKFENTRGFLANVYTYLPDAFGGFAVNDGGQFQAAFGDCMTDNASSYWNVHYVNSVQQGTYNATNHFFANTYWERYLKGIRAANQFMRNAQESVIGNAEKAGDDNRLYDRYMAEARLLRAIFHFTMVSYFGPIPVLGDDENGVPIILETSGDLNLSRTPAAEALAWVAAECDAVKDKLPFRYTEESVNWGRVNGATAYALKSRALLYRASALNNPSNDASWWSAAATAATDFITKNNQISDKYRLYTDAGSADNNYYACFTELPWLNDEYILSRSAWTTSEIDRYLTPCGFSGAMTAIGRTNPTQNLVDAYEMNNGLPIDDPNSGYDENDPYKNRDPRLAQTIFYHGMVWGDKNQSEERPIDISSDEPVGIDYQGLHGGTYTGYYVKKFVKNISWKAPTSSKRACPIFRYAEILLNAAEAINESSGPAQALQYVNEVRARAGMPAYSSDMTREKLRERIRNERRIELCFEDHRLFDVRRWRLYDGVTPENEKSKPRYQQIYNLYNMNITKAGGVTYSVIPHSKVPVMTFIVPRDYLFPIPDADFKKAPNLKQNPGWELSASEEEETPAE